MAQTPQAVCGILAYFDRMPRAEILSKQAMHTLGQRLLGLTNALASRCFHSGRRHARCGSRSCGDCGRVRAHILLADIASPHHDAENSHDGDY